MRIHLLTALMLLPQGWVAASPAAQRDWDSLHPGILRAMVPVNPAALPFASVGEGTSQPAPGAESRALERILHDIEQTLSGNLQAVLGGDHPRILLAGRIHAAGDFLPAPPLGNLPARHTATARIHSILGDLLEVEITLVDPSGIASREIRRIQMARRQQK